MKRGDTMDISKRHEAIIKAIVSMYINGREPVASSALQDYLNMAVSSATLRNEMAYLTKQGFLNQPHVSAGRVPTNKAYRYYIENMGDEAILTQKDKEYIKGHFDLLDHDSQRFLQGAAELFSDLFKVTTIIAPPLDKDMKFANFNILKTGKYDVVLIGVTSRGDVHTRVIRLATEITNEDINQLIRLVNTKLCFVSWQDVDKRYFDYLIKELAGENKAYSQIIKGALALMKMANTQNIHLRGEQYLLKTSDFDANIADILKVLSDKETVKNIITPKLDGVSVVFGDELPIKNIDNVCFISKKFYVGSAVSGTFCVVCPQTVDYKKLFASIQYFTQLLSQTITGTERNI
ncbi:MAG: heat-inducible transcription repressor HrcA [Oscillospiraceae bacterium]|nr:heat-inducible transcription repressor HrcA [Oscillospiraceae bacterium]MBQ5313214.1 heat-inducible transcription repressor HrcA [Oscillospiraceae bacterium]